MSTAIKPGTKTTTEKRSAEIEDAAIEAALPGVLKKIEATRALYDLLLELKRKDQKTLHGYSESEAAELTALHRRHLLRRCREEAQKAGISI